MTVKTGAAKILTRFALNETGFRYTPPTCNQILPEVQKIVDTYFGNAIDYEDKKTVLAVARSFRGLPLQAWHQNKVCSACYRKPFAPPLLHPFSPLPLHPYSPSPPSLPSPAHLVSISFAKERVRQESYTRLFSMVFNQL